MNHQIEFIYSNYLTSQGISIDTRTLKEGDIFFGIRGDNFNGNAYAQQALANGASFAVIDDKKFADDERIFLVEDSIIALQKLAKLHRSKFQGEVVAITGSNGKTTTKELIREVLLQKYGVHATQGNYNNHLGVPLTILQVRAEAKIAIIEMGANHLGEIARLCEIAQPTMGLITSIGQAHTEGFGGMNGVLRGKSELFDYLKKTDGMPFINLQDHYLKHMTKRFEKAEVFPAEDVKLLPTREVLTLSIGGLITTTHLSGAYNFLNAAAAVAVGRYFSIDDKQLVVALERYKPTNQRSQILKSSTNTILLDVYNANPDSMRVALKSFAKFDGRKVAILGDMNELSSSVDAHRQLGRELAQMDVDEVILVGEKMRSVLDLLPDATHFTATRELIDYLTGHTFKDSVILLKASRSMKLEEAIDKL